VRRDRRLGGPKRAGQLAHRPNPIAEQVEHRPPRRIGDGAEDVGAGSDPAHAASRMINHRSFVKRFEGA
jgi:hypothetical protein